MYCLVSSVACLYLVSRPHCHPPHLTPWSPARTGLVPSCTGAHSAPREPCPQASCCGPPAPTLTASCGLWPSTRQEPPPRPTKWAPSSCQFCTRGRFCPVRAAITNYHTLGGLKQQKLIVSQIRRQAVWDEGVVGRLGSFWGLSGRSCPTHFSSLLVVAGQRWRSLLVDVPLQCLHLHMTASVCAWVQICLFLWGHGHIRFRAHPNPVGPCFHLITSYICKRCYFQMRS